VSFELASERLDPIRRESDGNGVNCGTLDETPECMNYKRRPGDLDELLGDLRSETDSASGGGNNGNIHADGQKVGQEKALRLFELL
jgi:hypothetical protein